MCFRSGGRRKRRQGWIFFIIFLLTLSVYLLINYPLQLGLDLQGGSQLTLQIIKEEGMVTKAVSYTHLTLPTS